MKLFSDDTIKNYSNTIGERNEVDKIMSLPLFIQTIFGFNVLDPSWTWRKQIFKQIFFTSLLVYKFLGTIDFLKNPTGTTAVAEGYSIISVSLIIPIKYLLFVNNRKTFQTLYLIAKTTLLEMVKTDSIEKSNELQKQGKMGVKVLVVTVLFPVVAYFAVAFWNYIHGNKVNLNKSSNIMMPMTTPYYEIGLIIHTTHLFNIVFTFLVIDLWFVLVVHFFCTACNSLAQMLKDEPKKSDESELAYAIRLNDTLRIFYKYHQMLMEYFNMMSDMYKWPTLIPLITVGSTICLLLFSMNEEIQWAFLTCLIPGVMELFAYNWFGEQVKLKGGDLNMALLHFDWTRLRIKDKKNYLIIISYMTREFSVKTAVGNELSLRTMSAVLKASYQTAAVLNNMGE